MPFWGVAAIPVPFAQDVNNGTAAIAMAHSCRDPRTGVATHHDRPFAPARWVPKNDWSLSQGMRLTRS